MTNKQDLASANMTHDADIQHPPTGQAAQPSSPFRRPRRWRRRAVAWTDQSPVVTDAPNGEFRNATSSVRSTGSLWHLASTRFGRSAAALQACSACSAFSASLPSSAWALPLALQCCDMLRLDVLKPRSSWGPTSSSW